jgi:RimJ/RimL family protein N-acetyltransferase
LSDSLEGWQARPRPSREVLEGRYCRLETLDRARHGDALFAASTAPGAEDRFRFLWEPVPDRAQFDEWIAGAAVSEDLLFHAVVDRATGRCEGRQAYLRITPEHGVIEIGAILWGPAISRTRVATEALAVYARHAFEVLGYRRFEWKCDARNEPSRRAALRFGFAYEGTFRQHMVVKGGNRDTAWFAMTDGDWPRVGRALERWLDPSNFDAYGRQKVRLQVWRGEESEQSAG